MEGTKDNSFDVHRIKNKLAEASLIVVPESQKKLFELIKIHVIAQPKSQPIQLELFPITSTALSAKS